MPRKITITNCGADKGNKEPVPVLKSINNALKKCINDRAGFSRKVDPLMAHLINSGVWKKLPELKTLTLEFDPDDVATYPLRDIIKDNKLSIEVLYKTPSTFYRKDVWYKGKELLIEIMTDNIKVEYEYDAADRLIKKTVGPVNVVEVDVHNDNEVRIETHEYLENGNEIEIDIVNGIVNRKSVTNKDGKTLHTIYPEEGYSETFTYNEKGDTLSFITTEVIDGVEKIKTQTTEYNEEGCVTKLQIEGDDDIGHSVRIGYVYDEEGNIVRIED